MITLLLKIVLFLTQSEWSTQRIINKTPSLNREGWGGSLVWVSLHPPHTLYTLWNRVQGLCLSAFCTLTPSNQKFPIQKSCIPFQECSLFCERRPVNHVIRGGLFGSVCDDKRHVILSDVAISRTTIKCSEYYKKVILVILLSLYLCVFVFMQCTVCRQNGYSIPSWRITVCGMTRFCP